MIAHVQKGYHHTHKHFVHFHLKHNVSVFTISLLIILAVQVNLLYTLGMMPEQSMPIETTMSFAGSTLPNMVDFIRSFF